MTQVIVLNGGSSAGKSSLARALQDRLPQPWLTFGVDTLIAAMPAALRESNAGLDLRPDGTVAVGPAFRALEAAWIAGIAGMVRAGGRVIVDEVFLGGAESQRPWRAALEGLDVLWVGVRCDAAVAAAREAGRPDRVPGMAASQAAPVHRGMRYGVEVDTARATPAECAAVVAARLA